MILTIVSAPETVGGFLDYMPIAVAIGLLSLVAWLMSYVSKTSKREATIEADIATLKDNNKEMKTQIKELQDKGVEVENRFIAKLDIFAEKNATRFDEIKNLIIEHLANNKTKQS